MDLVWRTRDHSSSSCTCLSSSPPCSLLGSHSFLSHLLLGSHSFPILHDTAVSLQLLLRPVCITLSSPRQLATALSWLRHSCTVNVLGHLSLSLHFINRCWMMDLWAPFLQLDIKKTTEMIGSNESFPGSSAGLLRDMRHFQGTKVRMAHLQGIQNFKALQNRLKSRWKFLFCSFCISSTRDLPPFSWGCPINTEINRKTCSSKILWGSYLLLTSTVVGWGLFFLMLVPWRKITISRESYSCFLCQNKTYLYCFHYFTYIGNTTQHGIILTFEKKN